MPKFTILVQENQFRHGTVEVEAETPEKASEIAQQLETDLDESQPNILRDKIKWDDSDPVLDFMTDIEGQVDG